MGAVLLQPAPTYWECAACTFTDVTREARPHSRMHTCTGLGGLSVPMVRAGTRCKMRAVEREDYVGDELVTYDDGGRPVMSVVTTRDDGEDCTVYAPTATARLAALA